MKYKYFTVMVLLLFFATAFELKAQITINKSVLGNGGESMKNDIYVVNSTLGQSFIGTTNNLSFTNKMGFWYQAKEIVTSADEIATILPQHAINLKIYPNPFYSKTSIQYELSSSVNALEKVTKVEIKVFDAFGREIQILVTQIQIYGKYEVEWNAGNFPAGVYYCRLKTGKIIQTKKMILLN